MDFKPLPEQQEIIDLRNKNLIVSASAGSGKTTVMIERICKLIEDEEVSPKGLLVLTYTKSAASEMKQKLYNALRKKSQQLKNYNQIMDELAIADISTIHSFCSRLIKKYFHVLGISPNFEIIDEAKSKKIKIKILENCINQFAGENFEQYLVLMKNFAPNRKHDNLFKIILDINNYTKNYISRNDFEKIATFLYKNNNVASQILNDEILQQKQNFNNKIQNLLNICSNLDLKKYIEYLNKISGNLEKISKNNDFLTNFNVFYQFSLPKFFQDNNVDQKINNMIESLKNDIKTVVSKYKLKNYGDSNLQITASKNNFELINILLKLEQDFYIKFKQYKTENNLFDYSDLEELAIEICQIDQIQQALKDTYKYVFIDEYQDANEVQERLLSLICNDNNRFMVGDVKQSIYRFRGSKPEIFLKLEKEYEDSENSQAKRLAVNFRSDKQILNFVNYVFEKIMTIDTGGVDFKLKGKFEKTDQVNQDQPKVQILICDKQQKQFKQTASGLYNINFQTTNIFLTDSQKEGMAVGKEILGLLKEKIIENNVERNIKFSDITILVRKRGENYKQFCDSLIELGVPIYASTSSNILDNPESKRFVNLLKTCISLKDDISLVSTLVTYFDFTENDLVQIKLENNCDCFYDCVLQQANKQHFLLQKLQSFFADINFLQQQINRLGCYKALKSFFIKRGYFEHLMAKKDDTRIEVVKKLLDEIKKDEYNFNAPAFISFVEKGGVLDSPNLSNGDNDFVNITTIHSSKGLEYPIVFIVDSGSDFTKTMTESLCFNENLGLGLKYYDIQSSTSYNDIVCDAIKLVNAKQEFAEKLRVLYVALTRPKNKLYIVGSTKLDSLEPVTSDKQVLQQKSFLDLILACFDQNVLDKIKQNNFCLYKTDLMQIAFSIINDQTFTKQAEKNVLFGKGNKQLEDLFKQKLSNKLIPNIVALKNSVSGISNDFNYENVLYSVEKLTIDEHLRKQNRAEMGTNFHKILELMEYKDYDNQEKLELFSKTYNTDKNKISKALKTLYDLFKDKPVYKENKFIMKVNYNEVVDSEIKDEILVQGIIDAFCVCDDRAIIVDFKLTNIKDENLLKQRYLKQLKLYEKAVKKAFNINNIELYLLSLENCNLIRL